MYHLTLIDNSKKYFLKKNSAPNLDRVTKIDAYHKAIDINYFIQKINKLLFVQ